VNELKATPGPWLIRQGDEWTNSIVTLEGKNTEGEDMHWEVASYNLRRDEAKANAALIAAAWDMYQEHKLRHEALRQMLGGAATDEFKRLDALLKKARGE